MKIIRTSTIDWATLAIEAEDSFEYEGPIAFAKDSGSPPQAVDPYTQANAQYGLSTGTALFNAGLNRTNQQNPVGSTTWSASYPGGTYNASVPGGQVVNPANPPSGWNYPPGGNPNNSGGGLTGPSASGPGATVSNGGVPAGSTFGGSSGIPSYGLGGSGVPIRTPSMPYNGSPTGSPTGGAPTYTQTTSLGPQFDSMLQKPIDTSGLAGMPGGPSTTQDLQTTRDALYQGQQQYLKPEQDLASEQLKSQLANQGITPGSAAYNNEMDRLSREQEFQNSSARTQAITGGGAEQSRLFGLGTQSLQNQLAVRNAPISEWAALNGSGGASAQALTPDISGAFGQQLNSQLAGYNANVASNNATTADAASLAMMAMMMFSDKRLKENIHEVGETKSGLPVYTYNYKGDPTTQMGVMAQDVEKEQPEAVFGLGGRDNFKMVDYRQIA